MRKGHKHISAVWVVHCAVAFRTGYVSLLSQLLTPVLVPPFLHRVRVDRETHPMVMGGQGPGSSGLISTPTGHLILMPGGEPTG